MTAPDDDFEELARVAWDARYAPERKWEDLDRYDPAYAHTREQWIIMVEAVATLDRKRQRERLQAWADGRRWIIRNYIKYGEPEDGGPDPLDLHVLEGARRAYEEMCRMLRGEEAMAEPGPAWLDTVGEEP